MSDSLLGARHSSGAIFLGPVKDARLESRAPSHERLRPFHRNLLQRQGDAEVPAGHPVRRGRHHRACGVDRDQRIAGGPRARLAAQPRHPANQLADHLRGRPVPFAAAAGHHRADLFRRAGRRPLALGLRLDLAVARSRADGLLGGDLLGRHHVGAQGPVGGRALDRARLRPDPFKRRAAAGAAPHHPAAHQPHHRHHQGHGARHRRRSHRDFRRGEFGHVQFLQSLAIDDGRRGLPRAVPARRRGSTLGRDQVRVEAMIQTFFNPEIIAAAWPIVLAGLLNTILLSLIVVPLGLFGGLFLALLASVRHPLVRWPLMAWVDFFRAFPPLVLLVLLFAGLPFAGLELGGFACVAIAFFQLTSAYYGEIFPAGIESIPRGQVEGARSTGLSRLQALCYIGLPQAVRNVLPHLLSNTREVVKLTSLGSVVAVPELLYQARQAQSLTYNPTPIVVAAIIYFLLLWPLVRLLSRLENRALAGRH